jgi:hypothetical protein
MPATARRLWQRDNLVAAAALVWLLAFATLLLVSSSAWAPGNAIASWLTQLGQRAPLLARLALVASLKGLVLGGPPLAILLGLLPLLDVQVNGDRQALSATIRLRLYPPGLIVAAAALALGGVVAALSLAPQLPCHSPDLSCATTIVLRFLD